MQLIFKKETNGAPIYKFHENAKQLNNTQLELFINSHFFKWRCLNEKKISVEVPAFKSSASICANLGIKPF